MTAANKSETYTMTNNIYGDVEDIMINIGSEDNGHGSSQMNSKPVKAPVFSETDHGILVNIVKMAQAREVIGSKGGWKSFLKSQFSANSKSTDPSLYSWDTLADFVKTFVAEKDIQMAVRMKKWKKRRLQLAKIDKYLGHSPALELVRLTYNDPRFRKFYTFPSYNEGWLITKLGKPENEDNIIAIDCEMGRCNDGTPELIKVCAVDQNKKVLIDTLVRPLKHVVDFVTHITGITARDLTGVHCTLKDVQKMLKGLLKPTTILVGHSLYNDLKVLRVEHARVIDTAFIFRINNRPVGYTPSLQNLCKVVLNRSVRNEGTIHNCLDDAVAPMELVLAKTTNKFTEPIDMPDMEDTGPSGKLLIHRIPQAITSDDLYKLFSRYSVKIKDFANLHKKFKCTTVVFKTTEEANESFENLDGHLKEDERGYPQKTVPLCILQSGKRLTCYVRKMCKEEYDHDSVAANRKRPYEATADTLPSMEKSPYQKILKLDLSLHNPMVQELSKNGCVCIHFLANERMKEQLKEKDAEIRELQQRVRGLSQRCGL